MKQLLLFAFLCVFSFSLSAQCNNFQAAVNATNPACAGSMSWGSATASASGGTAPYTYIWSNGSTGTTISNLSPGTYTTTVTDANGCATSNNGTIAAPTAVLVTVNPTNAPCADGSMNGGSATANTSGGTPGYTYIWSNGATSSTISNLSPGTYTTTVTDANGCYETNSATITAPPALITSVNAINPNCAGSMSWGSATASTSGGTAPYTYAWSNGATADAISNLSPGTYTTTVTDANGCATTNNATITAPPALTGNNNTTICATESIVINGTIYNAANPTGTEVFTNIGPNGCDSTVTIALDVLPAIDISITSASPSLTANLSGASYQWLDCNNANAIIPSETNQSYTATVTGDFAVQISVGNCIDTSACENLVINHVGLEEESNLLGVNIYPNPTNGIFTINLNKLNANTTIVLSTISGKKIINQKLENTTTLLNLTKYDNGVYFLSIENENEVYTKKIIKQ